MVEVAPVAEGAGADGEVPPVVVGEDVVGGAVGDVGEGVGEVAVGAGEAGGGWRQGGGNEGGCEGHS